MALIECPECGTAVSERATACPKCGCPISIIKNSLSDRKKKRNRKIRRYLLILLLIPIVMLAGFYLLVYRSSPVNTSIRLIKEDLGRNINIENIYYNADIGGCLIYFSNDGEKDIATVNLDNKKVGYKSVVDKLSEKSKQAITSEEEEKYARQVMDYADVYNIFWEIDFLVNGDEENEWEKIK